MSLMQALDRGWGPQEIQESDVDWAAYMYPEDRYKVIPAFVLDEEGKKAMLVGDEKEEGFPLPWLKTHGKCLIRPANLAIWCGWTHHGKSQLVQQVVALQGVRHGHRVLIASMEQTPLRVWKELCRMFCGTGEPTLQAIEQFMEFAGQRIFFLNHQGHIRPELMQAVIRYSAKKLGVTQAIVDSLMCVQIGKDAYEEQRNFTAELKAMATELGITNHLVAHMRKRGDKGGDEQMGTTHDIAGPHEIASLADMIFNVWRNKVPKEKRTDKHTPYDAMLGIEKQRGETNWIGRVGLDFHEGSRQFTDSGARFPMRFDNP